MTVATQHRRHNSSFSSFGSLWIEFDLSDCSGYFEANEFVLDNNFIPACDDLMARQNVAQIPQPMPMRCRLGSGSSFKFENMESIAENKFVSAIGTIARGSFNSIPRIPPPSLRSSSRSLVEASKDAQNKSISSNKSTQRADSSERESCADSNESATSVKQYQINNAIFSQSYSSYEKDDEITFKVGDMFCKTFEESMRFDLSRCDSMGSFSNLEEQNE